MRRSVVVTLAFWLTLIVVAVILLLTRAPIEVAATNSIPAKAYVELEKGDASSCQPAGTLPQGTSAIRISIEARAVGPMVAVKVFSGSRLITQGDQIAGWGAAPTVTVPVKRLTDAVNGASICTTVGPTVEPVRVLGMQRGPHAETNTLRDLKLRMEYLRPSPKSWWSLASSVAYHMGLGRAASGTWIVFLALALMLAVAALAARLALEEL